jgi:hypothetical protein
MISVTVPGDEDLQQAGTTKELRTLPAAALRVDNPVRRQKKVTDGPFRLPQVTANITMAE